MNDEPLGFWPVKWITKNELEERFSGAVGVKSDLNSLTSSQFNLLCDLDVDAQFVSSRSKPAKKLVELGWARWTPGQFSLVITPEGKQALKD